MSDLRTVTDTAVQSFFGVTTLASAFVTWVLSVTLPQWVAAASLCSILLHAAYLIWKWRREAQEKA